MGGLINHDKNGLIPFLTHRIMFYSLELSLLQRGKVLFPWDSKVEIHNPWSRENKK